MALADQPLTLCAGSMVRFPFADLVDAAAHAGFAAITVTGRLRHVARRGGLTDRDLLARIRDRGLRVAEIEGTPGWLRGPRPADPRVLGLDEALDLAATLGATSVVAYHDGRTRPPCALSEDFGEACDRAAERGLTMALEFLPWSPVPTLRAAAAIVAESARPNGRIVLDTWHHAHSGQSSLPLEPGAVRLISCLQLVDARAPESDDLVRETMFGRRVPGTGTLGLATVVARAQAAGVNCPVAVEVYDETLADLDARAYAVALAEGARQVLRR